MAARADWDYGDDFEVLNRTSPIEIQGKFEVIGNDSFEITPPLLINTSPIQHVTIIEKTGPTSIKIDKPIINEVKQVLENSSPPSTNSSCLPIRYGSAAIIPHNEGFDLKSILDRKPSLSNQSNDLLYILQEKKSKTPISTDNNIQQLLIDNSDDRKNLVQIAKQIQEDFMNAIRLD